MPQSVWHHPVVHSVLHDGVLIEMTKLRQATCAKFFPDTAPIGTQQKVHAPTPHNFLFSVKLSQRMDNIWMLEQTPQWNMSLMSCASFLFGLTCQVSDLAVKSDAACYLEVQVVPSSQRDWLALPLINRYCVRRAAVWTVLIAGKETC